MDQPINARRNSASCKYTVSFLLRELFFYPSDSPESFHHDSHVSVSHSSLSPSRDSSPGHTALGIRFARREDSAKITIKTMRF